MKKQTALKIAVHSMKKQQNVYHPGHLEYSRSGVLFEWAVRAEKNWKKLEQAIQVVTSLMHEQEQLDLFTTHPPRVRVEGQVQEQEAARTEA